MDLLLRWPHWGICGIDATKNGEGMILPSFLTWIWRLFDAWNKFFFKHLPNSSSLMVICYGTISANDKLVVWVGGLGF